MPIMNTSDQRISIADAKLGINMNWMERALHKAWSVPTELYGLLDSEGFTLLDSESNYLKVRA